MASFFPFASVTPSPDQQSDLLRNFQRASTSANREAALTAIHGAFARYVSIIAYASWKRFGHVKGRDGLEDIESAGRHALVRAVHRWQPGYGSPFVHLASRWISEQCKAEAAYLTQRAFTIPARVRRLCGEYRRLTHCVSSVEREHVMSNWRVRERTRMLIRLFGQCPADSMISLDQGALVDGGELAPISTTIAAEQPPIHEIVELNEMLEGIRTVLKQKCNARERFVYFARYPSLPLGVGEIGAVRKKSGNSVDLDTVPFDQLAGRFNRIAAVLEITRERVRQIDSATMTKVRAGLRRES